MNENRFVETWKLMEIYNFELINEQKSDYLCTICKKLLINPYSGPCGCRFCLKCIVNYLNGKEQSCPGNLHECLEENLNMEKNIHFEPTCNREILKSVVNCPNIDCEFADELRNIEAHIRVCDFKIINCPYFNFGCKEIDLCDSEMKKHFLLEIVSHSNLLLENINNMRNEMELTKQIVVDLKNENNRKKFEIEANRSKIFQLEEREKINCGKIDALTQEMIVLKDQNKSMIDELIKFKVDQSNQAIESKSDHELFEINKIKLKLESIENNQELSMKNFDGISKKNSELTTMSNNLNEIVKISIDSKIKNLQTQISEIEKSMVRKSFEEFEWVIENFPKLYQEYLFFSEPFYSHRNGYKFCLSSCLSNNNFFCVNVNLMRGKSDDDLPWPCRCSVTVDIINQNDKQIFLTKTMIYGNRLQDTRWNRPVIDRNEAIEFLKIPINDCQSLLKRDQIIVKCKTEIYQ